MPLHQRKAHRIPKFRRIVNYDYQVSILEAREGRAKEDPSLTSKQKWAW